MIKAILFDFDGVLTIDKTGSTSITNYISQKCNLPLEIIKTSYYKHNEALLNGDIVHKDIWETFCKDVGVDIPYQFLTDSFYETKLDDKMINYVKKLKENYFIGLITDNKFDRIDTIMKSNNLIAYFDCVAISASLHMNKKSRYIFEYVINDLNILANECVFIDNTEENLVIASELGMKTILFDDTSRDFNDFCKNLNSLLL